MKDYDSTADTLAHIQVVRDFIGKAITELVRRAEIHDRTKMGPNEKPVFDEFTPKLKHSTYGSEEYKGFLKSMGRALEHHYANHRHHPEHFTRGIRGMNLVDLLEMMIDWHAASKRHDDGDVYRSVAINQKRFGYSEELATIFRNTAGWLQSVDPAGPQRSDPRERARQNYMQDSIENAPFSSVGGLENRHNMKVPGWVMPDEEDEYLDGYREAAKEHLGDEWMTCEFSWAPALVIPEGEK